MIASVRVNGHPSFINGKLGIGRDPSFSLDVGTSAEPGDLRVSGTTGSLPELIMAITDAASQDIELQNSSGALRVVTGGVERLRLDATGLILTNVGLSLSSSQEINWGGGTTKIFAATSGDMTLAGNATANVVIPFMGLGVGTATPNANAILDLTSTSRAFLPPRMTTAQRDAIASPTAGMIIYNLTTNVLNFYNGTVWGPV